MVLTDEQIRSLAPSALLRRYVEADYKRERDAQRYWEALCAMLTIDEHVTLLHAAKRSPGHLKVASSLILKKWKDELEPSTE